MRAIKRGDLDRTPQRGALDILAQQIVAACVSADETGWRYAVRDLYSSMAYRDLKREDFDAVIRMHLNGRRGLLHRDGVGDGSWRASGRGLPRSLAGRDPRCGRLPVRQERTIRLLAP